METINGMTAESSLEKILGYPAGVLIKDLFEIMNEILANRDLATYKHTLRVAEIANRIGKAMALSQEDLTILEFGCLVHDIGKTAIPDDVLLKPNLFNDQDRRIMEFHPLIGAKLFARRLQDDRITHIILRHHERLDGSGYPLGLKGNEIDQLSRITAVADEFEALTARRPYKSALHLPVALQVLEEEAQKGTLDRHIVAVLTGIADSLKFDDQTLYPTGHFMEEIEQFRRDTFFRDTLSELYNYRYLLVLDDLKLLGETGNNGYLLMLIHFHGLGRFQVDNGVIVAGQVHDEIGQRLGDTVEQFREKRKQYDGSVILFRKHCDYLIYAEGNSEKALTPLIDQVRSMVNLTHEEWGLQAECFRRWLKRDMPIEKGLADLFLMEVARAESCQR
ncbi:MAG: HD domain-containing phosphohydrolase [Thermodesulfobacteriota bacterium]